MSQIGRYEIEREIGRGAMGVVYAGTDPLLRRKVAIKTVLPPNAAAELSWEMLVQRLAREAQAAAVLNHPNIIAVYDIVPIDNMFCVVMELVNGKSLADTAPLGMIASAEFAVRVIREAAAALDHAHSRGVIHRDVKPSNIILDQNGVAKLADFGIAKMMGSATDLTQNVALGTVEFMSPEQVNMKPLDGRADQYSLGVMAYGLLTGARVYDADTVGSWLANLMTQPPPPPTSRNARLPHAIDPVFAKVLAKDPAQRYDSCLAFAADLSNVLLGMSATQAFAQAMPSSASSVVPPHLAVTSAVTPPFAGASVVISPQGGQGAPPALAQTAVVQPAGRKISPALIGAISALLVALLASSAAWMMSHRAPPPVLNLPTGDMLLVEKGEALLGEKPHPVMLNAFYVDRTEVSNRAYLEFCRATGRVPPAGSADRDPNLPVVNVTHDDAQAFAKWAGKRLPTGEEWERAARGSQGQIYPWGNDLNYALVDLPRRAENGEVKLGTLLPVDSMKPGASPAGAVNMLGNVWEWTATPDTPNAGIFDDLTHMFRDLSPTLSRNEPYFQIRGGSYKNPPLPREHVADLVWDSSPIPARVGQDDIGFRCVKDP